MIRGFMIPIMLVLSACSGEPEKRERPAALVSVEPVALHDFVDRYVAVGTANANEQVSVTAPVTERITQLGFSDGAYVRQGQMLAVLAQGQEAASLASAKANAVEAEKQLARISALHRRGFATNASLDTQTALAAAARGAAGEASASIGDRVIRAPFSGQVSLRRISVGAVVSAGDEIAVISDTRSIKLDFTVPETMLASVQAGQSIAAKAAAFPDVSAQGRIVAIDPVVNPQTRTATLRAILPNPGQRLKPGMLMSVTLESRARQSVAVPELALVREGQGSFVYTVGPDKKAKRLPVTTGGRDGNLVEILNGLAPGDKIVTLGVVKLTDGATVRTGKEATAPANKPAATKPAG